MKETHMITKIATKNEQSVTSNEKVQRVLEQIRKENRGKN